MDLSAAGGWRSYAVELQTGNAKHHWEQDVMMQLMGASFGSGYEAAFLVSSRSLVNSLLCAFFPNKW
jgi:hypothetical protein